jgi:hypothetical protein
MSKRSSDADLSDHYDFSKARRGVFHRPGTKIRVFHVTDDEDRAREAVKDPTRTKVGKSATVAKPARTR